MAVVQLGRTRGASKLISYCEKRAVEVSGVDCPYEYAKSQFKATRELWGKPDGIQAHHVIQSFNPGEVTPQQANEIGKDLAKEIAKGHEVTVYTHADTKHIHNHIVINSVSFESGKKYQAHGKDTIEKFREISDRLCQDRNLSIIKEPYAMQRYCMAERGMAERGEVSWKDQIRDAIDIERQTSTSYEDLKKNLNEKYGIAVNERGKNHISYKHPDYKVSVKGTTLGLAYERGTIENELSRQIERTESQERGFTDLSSAAEKSQGIGGTLEGNNQAQRIDEGLHASPPRQGHNNSNDLEKRTEQHNKDQQGSTRGNAFDFEKAEQHARDLQRGIAKDFGEWQTGTESQQPSNLTGNEINRQELGKEHGRNQGQEQSDIGPLKPKDLGIDLEH